MRLNQVTVAVSDISRSVEFSTKLGLHRIVGGDEDARFVCRDGDSTFSVYLTDSVVDVGGVVVYFECDDIDE